MYIEKQYVINQFRSNFSRHIDKKFVLYGVGNNTKAILEECTEFQIIGLMDQAMAGSTVFELPVFTVWAVFPCVCVIYTSIYVRYLCGKTFIAERRVFL